MTKPSKPPRFIPLNLTSQGNCENVLYFNANAPAHAIYECASARLEAVINLLDVLHDFSGAMSNNAGALSVVTSYLLNDANILFEAIGSLMLDLEK